MYTKPRTLIAVTTILGVAGSVAWFWQAQRPGSTGASAGAPSSISNPQSLLPLHPVVKQIVKDGPTTLYLKLNYIIKELPTDLARHDIDALLSFIVGAKPESFSDGEWGSLTNDIQQALSVQDTPDAGVARALIRTYRDGNQPRMMRDYALQHVGGFAIHLVHTAHTRGGLPPFFGDLTGELIVAARDTSNSWAGTSLNLLDGLLRAAEERSMTLPEVMPETLVTLALAAAKDPAAPLNVRLPALQVASRRDSPAARTLAREILTSPEPGVMLVQSASATLARLGTAEDLPLLETASAAASRHTAPALQQAIRAIHDRIPAH